MSVEHDSGEERWRAVDGFPGYEVSDFGRVRSYRFPSRDGWRTGPTPYRFMTQTRTRGYPRVGLTRDRKTRCICVHRLVLLAFVGPCPPGMQACHNDDDKENNHLSNLRWDTPKANSADRVRNGHQTRGETNARSKLTDAAVAYIRQVAGRTKTLQEVAEELGVTKGTVWAAAKGCFWKHVDAPREPPTPGMVGRLRARRAASSAEG